MPTKPQAIVHSTYRRKRLPKRRTPVAIPMRIVTAKPPKKHLGEPVQQIGGMPEPKPERPRIVTASRKTSTRFGPVQDIDAEEQQRRGDAAVALFREIVRFASSTHVFFLVKLSPARLPTGGAFLCRSPNRMPGPMDATADCGITPVPGVLRQLDILPKTLAPRGEPLRRGLSLAAPHPPIPICLTALSDTTRESR